MKKRILIKISGASLKGVDSTFEYDRIIQIVDQIKVLASQYAISIVVGGGNIFRGSFENELSIDKNDAHAMGMLATMINGIMLLNAFKNNNIKAKLFSAVKIDKFIDEYTTRAVNEALENEYVCIFVGGTGNPHFTTDTGATLRAIETKSTLILMGKNGVDGVYSADPKINSNSIRYDKLTYLDVINKSLDVMDHSALTLCKDNNIEILVFNINLPNAIVDALNRKNKTTLISNEIK